MQRKVPLLRIPKLLHVATELDFLDGEAAQLRHYRARLEPHILGEYAPEQVEREPPPAQQ